MIVEICGQCDTGKSLIGQALGRAYGVQVTRFPNMRLDSYSGKALSALFANGNAEFHAHWWALMSAANMTENTLTDSFNIVVNYKTAFRAWFRALGIQNASEFIKHLPEPDYVFVMIGDSWTLKSDFDPRHSEFLKRTVNNSFSSPLRKSIPNQFIFDNRDKGIKTKQIHATLNNILGLCTAMLDKSGKVPRKAFLTGVDQKWISKKIIRKD